MDQPLDVPKCVYEAAKRLCAAISPSDAKLGLHVVHSCCDNNACLECVPKCDILTNPTANDGNSDDHSLPASSMSSAEQRRLCALAPGSLLDTRAGMPLLSSSNVLSAYNVHLSVLLCDGMAFQQSTYNFHVDIGGLLECYAGGKDSAYGQWLTVRVLGKSADYVTIECQSVGFKGDSAVPVGWSPPSVGQQPGGCPLQHAEMHDKTRNQPVCRMISLTSTLLNGEGVNVTGDSDRLVVEVPLGCKQLSIRQVFISNIVNDGHMLVIAAQMPVNCNSAHVCVHSTGVAPVRFRDVISPTHNIHCRADFSTSPTNNFNATMTAHETDSTDGMLLFLLEPENLAQDWPQLECVEYKGRAVPLGIASHISSTAQPHTSHYTEQQQQQLIPEQLPRHIAIVMDGNGRWAKSRSLPRSEGHIAGVEAIHRIIRSCRRLGIPYLTLYAFSAQNWSRPPAEVKALMNLLIDFVQTDCEELIANGVRLLVNGDIDKLPSVARSGLQKLMNASRRNTGLTLCLALSYGGREEIASAARALCRAVKAGHVDPDEVTVDSFRSYMPNPDVPDPDLLIRTSGELRISNFLLWQIAYTELFVCDTLWPDFGDKDLVAALLTYAKRERRFGKTSEQVIAPEKHTSNSVPMPGRQTIIPDDDSEATPSERRAERKGATATAQSAFTFTWIHIASSTVSAYQQARNYFWWKSAQQKNADRRQRKDKSATSASFTPVLVLLLAFLALLLPTMWLCSLSLVNFSFGANHLNTQLGTHEATSHHAASSPHAALKHTLLPCAWNQMGDSELQHQQSSDSPLKPLVKETGDPENCIRLETAPSSCRSTVLSSACIPAASAPSADSDTCYR